MTVNERAGRPAEASALVDVEQLVKAYYEERPDPSAASREPTTPTYGALRRAASRIRAPSEPATSPPASASSTAITARPG